MAGGAPDLGRASRRSPVPEGLHFRDRPWRRRGRIALAALVLAVMVAVGVALPVVVLPQTQPVPGETDAVVLLAGGDGERFATAERVMPRGSSDVLVVSDGDRDDWPDGRPRCGATAAEGYEIRCVEAVPPTTRGEARAAAQLAGEEGWDSLTVLTSTYHVTRAQMLFERCVDAQIEVVDATPDIGPVGWVRSSVRELIALLRDGVVQRGC